MKNNKGFTVIELVVTFVFVMIISIGMLSLINGYRTKQQKEAVRKSMNSYKNQIVKAIQDDLNLYGIDSIKYISNEDEILEGYSRGIIITFKAKKGDNNIVKYLKLKNKTVADVAKIEYDGVVYNAPDKFVNLISDTMYYDSKNEKDDEGNPVNTNNSYVKFNELNGKVYKYDKTIYTIEIKMKNDDINEDFTIHIVSVKSTANEVECYTSINDEGVLTGYKWNVCGYTNIIVPKEFKTKTVTGIDSSTFTGYIDINNNGEENVYETNRARIETIDLSYAKDLTTIGNDTFRVNYFNVTGSTDNFCGKKTNTILKGLEKTKIKTIGDNAFQCMNIYGENKQGIRFPETITSIGKSAFRFHTLNGLVFENNNNVEEELIIGDYAFDNFSNCYSYYDNNKEIAICDGTNNKNRKFNKIVDLDLSSRNITVINNSTFGYSQLNNKLILPEKLEIIKSNAFVGNEIVSLEIPGRVTKIETRAFYDNKIENLTFSNREDSNPENNSPFELESVADSFQSNKIEQGNKNEFIYNIEKDSNGNVKMNKEVIVGYAGGSPDVKIPEGTKTIGVSSFTNLSALKSVIISDTVEKIQSNAFAGNVISSVELGTGVQTIGSSAFYNNKIKELTIPTNVTNIGGSAFENNEISNLIFDSREGKEKLVINTAAFNNNMIPINGENEYIYPFNEDGTQDKSIIISYAGINKDITIPSDVKIISNGSLKCAQLSSVVIPKTVEKIKVKAFASNPGMKIYLEDKETQLANYNAEPTWNHCYQTYSNSCVAYEILQLPNQ